ncbi:MAG: TauD/TfdA dioxygenase family protein [Rubrivivax sp.]
MARGPHGARAEALAAALAGREAKMILDNPSTVHPAVISHPVPGRRTLFVNSIWTKRLLGLHLDLSESLLHMLFEWIKKPEFMVRFRWEKDSIAIWDNAGTQHYAVFDYAPHYRAGQRLTCGRFTPTLQAATSPKRKRPGPSGRRADAA